MPGRKPSVVVMVAVAAAFAGALAVGAQDLESLRRSIADGSTDEKRSALAAIRNLRTAEASALAVPALLDKNEMVRATAAASVVFLPPPDAARALTPLLRDRREFVRREAAFALGLAGDSSAIVPLAALLQKEKAIETRSAAAAALGMIGDTAAIPILLSILEKRPVEDEEFLRRTAARSIGQIALFLRSGRREVVTPQNFASRAVRYIELPELSESSKPAFETAVPKLLSVFASRRESDDTKRETAFALGAIGDVRALESLRRGVASADPYLAQICREAVEMIERRIRPSRS